MGKYLDSSGLSHLIGKIKDYVDTHGGGGGGLGIDDVYPVGSIYMSVSATDPGTLFSGTTWTRITDTFLLASGSTYTPDDGTHTTATGGAAEVTLTSAQSGVPAHSHTYTRPTVSSSGAVTNGISGGSHSHTTGNTTYTDYVITTSGATIGRRSIKPGTSTAVTNNVHSDAVISHHAPESSTHTHNLPNHSHTLTGGGVADNTAANAAAAHNNMPPYLPVYVWKRTA